jgi:hypothetical protein
MSAERDGACYLGFPGCLARSSRTNSFFLCVHHKMKQIYWLYYTLQRSSTSVNCWSSLLHAADTVQLRCLSLCRHELGQITISGYTRCGKETETEWTLVSFRTILLTRQRMQTWKQILRAINGMERGPSRLVQVVYFWHVFETCQVRILARTPVTMTEVFRNFSQFFQKNTGIIIQFATTASFYILHIHHSLLTSTLQCTYYELLIKVR